MKPQINLQKGDHVLIPTSVLGKELNVGIVIEKYSNMIIVDFSGQIGKYTISKHLITKIP